LRALTSRTPAFTRSTRITRALAVLGLCLGCSSTTLDAGSTRPHGKLPVDERNPIILANDGAYDNWQGEYAVLLANGGGPPLAGIIVNNSGPWPDLDANVAGWRALVSAARSSGLQGIPDPLASIGAPLRRPASGAIGDTVPNRSEGALFILDAAARLSLPYRPLVVVTGGRLTDVADAYLVDPTVATRIVVVSSLGTTTTTGGAMGQPNGEMDPWADQIVASRLRYVQVSAYYDQLADVPDSRLAELPANPLGAWIAAKQPKLINLPQGSDQVAVVAIGLASFALGIESVSAASNVSANATAGPDLSADPRGPAWLVTGSAGALAAARFWELLLDPTTFSR
jgi:hypothetical protein